MKSYKSVSPQKITTWSKAVKRDNNVSPLNITTWNKAVKSYKVISLQKSPLEMKQWKVTKLFHYKNHHLKSSSEMIHQRSAYKIRHVSDSMRVADLICTTWTDHVENDNEIHNFCLPCIGNNRKQLLILGRNFVPCGEVYQMRKYWKVTN